MTETHILIFGFVLTFGFLGYKVSGIIKKALENYANDISLKIEESERLKLKMVQLLDDANARAKDIEDEIDDLQYKAEQKIKEIQEKFVASTQKSIKNVKNSHLTRLENNKEEILKTIEKKIQICINDTIEEYVKNNLSDEDKTKAVVNILAKVDFKKMLK